MAGFVPPPDRPLGVVYEEEHGPGDS